MAGDNRGGRRAAAGRKPNDHATRETEERRTEDEQPDASVDAVPAWQLTAAGFFALGISVSEIARRLRRARPTVRRVRDEHPELILAAVRQLTNPADVFAPMLPGAALTYHAALKRADTSVARDVMDRLYGKPLVREQRLERRDVTITFIDAPDGGA